MTTTPSDDQHGATPGGVARAPARADGPAHDRTESHADAESRARPEPPASRRGTSMGESQAQPRRFDLGHPGGLQIAVTNFGARWLSCRVPMADGSVREVLLGHATLADHAREGGYLGAVVGRYANRIGHARFEVDGRLHRLVANEGPHQLHGGPEGFDRQLWQLVDHTLTRLRLRLHSPDGDQGYPGHLQAWVTYSLDADGAGVRIDFEAEVDQACPVSLASHGYFNLDGDDASDRDPAPALAIRTPEGRGQGAPRSSGLSVRQHRLRVAASQVLPVDEQMLPTGELVPVAGSAFDLRDGPLLGAGLGHGAQQQLARGYDHCLVLDEAAACGDAPAAELIASDGRLRMQLFTNYPGLQVYSGNHLAGVNGRDGRPLAPHAGVALEPQFFPDAPNRPQWPAHGWLLRPGQRLQRFMALRFSGA